MLIRGRGVATLFWDLGSRGPGVHFGSLDPGPPEKTHSSKLTGRGQKLCWKWSQKKLRAFYFLFRAFVSVIKLSVKCVTLDSSCKLFDKVEKFVHFDCG